MRANKKIIYIISHGHTARGAFQTLLLKKMVDSGLDVLVVAKKGSEKILAEKVKSQGADIDYFEPHGGHKDFQRTIFRSYVHQNINSNPALLEKYQRMVLDSSTSSKRRYLVKFYYGIGGIIREIKPLKWLYNKFERRIYYSTKAVDLLKKHNPVAIISTRPVDSMEVEILNAASRLGIHKIMYILSWDNITSKGVFPVLADSYLTWGQIMNQELKEYYKVNDSRMFLTGVTHFDIHAQVRDNGNNGERWIKELGLDINKPYLLFTMSASYYAPNEIDIIEFLAKELKEGVYGPDMQLIIRPHMLNFMERASDVSWKDRLEALKSSRVGIDFPLMDNSLLTWYMKEEDMQKLSYLIKGSTVCLNSGSTISIEAVAFDKPVVLTIFDTEEWPDWQSVKRVKKYIHLEKFLAFEACDVAESLEEMREKVLLNMKNVEIKQEERLKVLEAECFKVDGLASERFVENVGLIVNDIN